MSTVGWLALVAVLMFVSARLGYLAGREAAESRAAATIADLRSSLRRQGLIPARDTQPNRYQRSDERTPE